MAERLRGRAGVKQRQRRLDAEPLCRKCQEAGIVRAATEVDHIQPLALGGDDTDDNCQSLCDDCHALKTSSDASSELAASNHPTWLRPSAIPLTIISGPPCSGKTTYIEQHAKPDDIVIDLDGIMMRLSPGYKHWSGMLHQGLFNRAIRARNEMLGSLSRMKHGRAWFIVSAPTEAERNWWHGKLGGSMVLLHPGIDECKRRATERGTPDAIQGVDRWDKASRSVWTAPQDRKPKPSTGLDGWPI